MSHPSSVGLYGRSRLPSSTKPSNPPPKLPQVPTKDSEDLPTPLASSHGLLPTNGLPRSRRFVEFPLGGGGGGGGGGGQFPGAHETTARRKSRIIVAISSVCARSCRATDVF